MKLLKLRLEGYWYQLQGLRLRWRRLFHKKPVYSIAEIKGIRQRIRDILDGDGDYIDKRTAVVALEREFNSSNVIKALLFELLPHPSVTAGLDTPID